MTLNKLEKTGRMLYGNSWRSLAAEDLGVDESTIRTWERDGVPMITEEEKQGLIELLRLSLICTIRVMGPELSQGLNPTGVLFLCLLVLS
jgi:hypothetical protein